MDIKIRPLSKDDQRLLLNWLRDPLVLTYYEGRDQNFTLDDIISKFYQEDGEVRMILEYQNKPIGYLQYYSLTPLEYYEYGYSDDKKVFGIDLFIGIPSLWNQGLGTRYLTQLLKSFPSTIDYVVLDPLVFNERAIHCYEKVGFRKKKILKEHELHEGKFHDAWLMEYPVEK